MKMSHKRKKMQGNKKEQDRQAKKTEKAKKKTGPNRRQYYTYAEKKRKPKTKDGHGTGTEKGNKTKSQELACAAFCPFEMGVLTLAPNREKKRERSSNEIQKYGKQKPFKRR